MATTQITGRQIAAATVGQSNLGLSAGVNPNDAVIMSQLLALASGRSEKAPVRCALLATDFTFSSFNTGTNTITTTSTITTGNGLTLVSGDRVLVTTLSGANLPYNGIYSVSSLTGVNQLVRAADANTSGTGTSTDLTPGCNVIAFDGASSTKGLYYLAVPAAGSETITLNTSNINWIDISPVAPTVYAQVTRETPGGTQNGSNTAFTLVNTPLAGSEMIYFNGELLDAGGAADYTISGAAITMNFAPISTDKLRATYLH